MSQQARNFAILAVMTVGAILFGFAAIIGDSTATATFDQPTVADVTHAFVASDGSQREITIYYDPSMLSPEEAIAAALPSVSFVPGRDRQQFVATKKWPADAVPIVFTYNDVLDPEGIDGAVVADWAMDTWNAIPNHKFAFDYAGLTEAYPDSDCNKNEEDGVNTITFSNQLASHILGITCTMSDPPAEPSLDTRRVMYEADIHMNTATAWSDEAETPSDKYDLYSVMLHEFGHALGLSHSFPGTVMQEYFGDGVQMRVPQQDDLNGLRALYPAEAPTATPTNTSTPTATRTIPTNLPHRLFAFQASKSDGQPLPPTVTPTPTKTATQVPTSTPTQGIPTGVQARNWSWREMPNGAISVSGEVVNGSAGIVEDVELTARFYNAGGTLLATKSDYALVTTIAAKRDAPFEVMLINPPAGVASVTVEVSDYSTTPSNPVVTGLMVEDVTFTVDGAHNLRISGTVTNNAANGWDFVRPIVGIYDGSKVLAAEDTYVTNLFIAAGQSDSFTIVVTDGGGWSDARREFWVDAQLP